MATTHRFVGLPDNHAPVHLYTRDDDGDLKKFRQVLWGDYLHVDGPPDAAGWTPVVWAPNNPEKRQDVLIQSEFISKERPLEMIFVDVGQGDGAVLITPERGQRERIMVIDAGEHQNMGDFLDGRFKSYRTGFQFHAAVITHPDEDHYGGFREIFEALGEDGKHKIGFDALYQCGLVERPEGKTKFDRIGGLKPKQYKRGRTQYIDALATTKSSIREAFGDSAKNHRKPFAETMEAALANPRIRSYKMLSTRHGTAENGRRFMPEFAPSDRRGYTIEVLGPVVERIGGKDKLRRLGSYGETKNGHSVILKLEIGAFSVLFGGDLNERAEEWLLSHYSGLEEFPAKGTKAYEDMITDASRVFRADVMKVCHHGSEKVTDACIRAVSPAAFVVSSGDQEGHVHPRPDLLGRLGKLGRGEAPVLLATELQRSTRAREDQATVNRIKRELGSLADNPSAERLAEMRDRIDELARTNVDVWGSIYVKTDGRRLITAFKNEANSDNEKWFYFQYTLDPNGQLVHES